jgi:sugar/nucleoside kinase (ribokinase family)
MSASVASGAPDYVAIGHFTVDIMPWGKALGGAAIYAALTAARAGLRAGVLSRGNLEGLPRPVREQLELVSREVEIVIQASGATTTFTNEEVVDRRRQTLHAWGDEIDLSGLPADWRSASVIHLAPVARELDPRSLPRIAPGYLGVTPQGWLRVWPRRLPGHVRLEPYKFTGETLARFNAMVASSEELGALREAFDVVGRQHLAVVTRGRQGATAIDRGHVIEMAGYPSPQVVDSTGAGDVFAAMLFLLRARGEPVIRSMRHASAAAALSVGGRGVESVPAFDAVAELVEIEESRP